MQRSILIYDFLHTGAEEKLLWYASTTFVSNTQLLPNYICYSPLFRTESECSFMGHLIRSVKKHRNSLHGLFEDAYLVHYRRSELAMLSGLQFFEFMEVSHQFKGNLDCVTPFHTGSVN